MRFALCLVLWSLLMAAGLCAAAGTGGAAQQRARATQLQSIETDLPGIPTHLRVGGAHLTRCADAPGYCGALSRRLDPSLAQGPSIRIAYEWLPARDRHVRPRGTIVAVEGGPGYPSTGSLQEYAGTFARVRGAFNLLLVDNRGTGSSGLIRCPSLDDLPVRHRASGAAFDQRVGACGRALDHRFRLAGGRFLHAADLYATAYAVGDLHAVIRRLGLGRVELYGDSYGSWFAQAYAARHPGDLSALILDSTYAVRGLDPVYGSSGLVARQAMDRVCARSLACRVNAGSGSPVTRLGALLARVRRDPIMGRASGSVRVTVGPRQLVDLVQDGGSDPYVWRELDASVRAALSGDDVPLLRLAGYGAPDGGDADPGYFSDGAYMAVSCTDYPQLFALQDPVASRAGAYAAGVAQIAAGVFAPFSPREWVTMSGYSETYDACLDWPRPVHVAAVIPAGAVPLPARVPILAIGGDLDDLTPLHDVRHFAPGLGARVRVVDLHNTVHVTSEGDTTLDLGAACARRIIDAFVVRPGDLEHMHTGCAAQIPPVQTPGSYPLTLANARPAVVRSGPALSELTRQAVTVAAGALADATIRAATLGTHHGAGLRGGSWTSRGSTRLHLTLSSVRFSTDSTVTGTAEYRCVDGAVTGTLTLRHRGRAVRVTLSWNQRDARARARVGASLLELPAP